MLHGLLLLIFLICCSRTYGGITYNTLPSRYHKVTEFVPKVANKMCLLIPDEGPCRAEISMYYFMPESMNCSTFTWGGCQGNGNRFDTFHECMGTCLSKPGNHPHRPSFCNLRFDYGYCFGEDERWYYDEQWHVCKKNIYSGCGGNKNNFYTQEGCESVCRFGLGSPNDARETTANNKKVLIVDPPDTTTARGLNQGTPPQHTKTEKQGTTHTENQGTESEETNRVVNSTYWENGQTKIKFFRNSTVHWEKDHVEKWISSI